MRWWHGPAALGCRESLAGDQECGSSIPRRAGRLAMSYGNERNMYTHVLSKFEIFGFPIVLIYIHIHIYESAHSSSNLL
jgi:hypothetical protein